MKQINRLLIANRGEIAIRIMRTCREMGISTVAVFSEADKDALFVQKADEAVYIGGKQPNESYLLTDKILEAAKKTGANAIHPGYGFLSENTAFAQAVVDAGLIWVGPHPEAIHKMGSKIIAKEIMSKNGVPVIPGYQGEDQSEATIRQKAIEIGFPVLLKASAGGGGKGMRIVREEKELDKAISAAKSEALNAFGDDTLLIEKYFDSSRHIEFQIFGDKHGNAVHIFERECSIQRRYQKIVEESPSPIMTDDLRQKMGDAAVSACKAIAYDNAGTVEFIVAPDNSFYFLEVNTRLQVEHPVTEMVSGLDLVRLQIETAAGLPFSFTQADLQQSGHAIEVRIYAEDPANNFLPVSGDISRWSYSEIPGVRYDSSIEKSGKVDIYYDPMIAKVITHGKNRAEAIRKMQTALSDLMIAGITTNKSFLKSILENEQFQSGNFDTGFLDKVFKYQGEQIPQESLDIAVAALQVYRTQQRANDRSLAPKVPALWRNNFFQAQKEKYAYQGYEFEVEYQNQGEQLSITFAEKTFEAQYISETNQAHIIEVNGVRRAFKFAQTDQNYLIHSPTLGDITFKAVPRFSPPEDESTKGGYTAPMPGEITQVLVEAGQTVKSGEPLLTMISMKMETTIEAAEDGTIEEVFVEPKQFVEADTPMLKFKENDANK
ncbi:MAG: acetyl-CoA carboxylase biotin carboxylase subunit [Chitinophagales bacterium]|nr:acetyl-CoA carboxylase biotin carboxylase subunit [Chitinophagales bacterium]